VSVAVSVAVSCRSTETLPLHAASSSVSTAVSVAVRSAVSRSAHDCAMIRLRSTQNDRPTSVPPQTPRHPATIEGAQAHRSVDDMNTENPPETHQHGDDQPHPADDSDQSDRGRIRPLGNRTSQLPLVLSVPQAAAILGISKDLAYDLTARGELPSLRFGRRLVVPTRPLLKLLNGEGAPLFPQRSA
jgi:excisionase family DNA binding protein